MKTLLFMFALLPLQAFAGGTTVHDNATSISASESQSGASSTAANQGNNQATNVAFESPGTVKYGGSYDVRSAPPIAMGSFAGSFSSDYCGGTAQAGVSFMGGGVTGGHPVFDSNCQALRVAEKTFQVAAMLSGQAERSYQGGVTLDKDPYRRSDAFKATTAAMDTATLSAHLTQAGINVLCGISDSVRAAYVAAGVTCAK